MSHYSVWSRNTPFSKDISLRMAFPGLPGPQGPLLRRQAEFVYGREIVEEHMDACLEAGLAYCGLNAEVMPSQWEYQIGPVDPVTMGDELRLSRWLLYRIAEQYGVTASLDPKPVMGDWNGAGCHTNFSTNSMRRAMSRSRRLAKRSAKKPLFMSKTMGSG